MHLRITTREDRGFTTVELHGSLGRETAPELSHVIKLLEGCWRLDLSQLRSVDDEGVEMLARLRDAGVDFVGMSPYIALRLSAPSDDSGDMANELRIRRADRER